MPKFVTVRHLAEMFHKDPQTIRRWIEEDKKIMAGELYFRPEKDPAGHWLFEVVVVQMSTTDGGR